MPPCKNYAKSQEFVYKKVGRGSLGGGRKKFKLVATDIPRKNGPSGTMDVEALAKLPPIVSAPSAAENGNQSFSDHTYFDNIHESRPKKTGKVCLILFCWLE